MVFKNKQLCGRFPPKKTDAENFKLHLFFPSQLSLHPQEGMVGLWRVGGIKSRVRKGCLEHSKAALEFHK